jgi:hypothetical protein
MKNIKKFNEGSFDDVTKSLKDEKVISMVVWMKNHFMIQTHLQFS